MAGPSTKSPDPPRESCDATLPRNAMFKKLLKNRHDRKIEAPPSATNNGGNQGKRLSSFTPDEYPWQQGSNSSDTIQLPVSCVPVDYNMSPPTPFGGGNSVSSPMPYGGVEYVQSPPIDQSPPPRQQKVSMAAVEYSQSQPVMPEDPTRNVSMGPAVEYKASAPSMPEDPARNISMGPAVEYRTSSPSRPTKIPYNEPLHVYAAELPAHTSAIPHLQPIYHPPPTYHPQPIYHPQELSGSIPQQRCELPATSIQRPSIPNTPSSTSNCPRSPQSTCSTTSTYSTAASTPATSPPSPYPNHNQAPRFAPPAPAQAVAKAPSSSDENNGIIKFTVNIFCQKKAPEHQTTTPFEELPRDVREFRLAKVALIPVSAGERRYVSLDVVFGEVDKGVAGFLEKHYLITPDSKLEKYIGSGISGNENVWKIRPLKVAYKGFPSLVYLTFRSPEDERKFQTDFEKMKKLSEHC